ncbi:MAG: ribose-phosphate diphosphokinase [Capsulimonadales bacterium]|nr:ribose-phosphate diphosphokinase [Capsulimonadales bacterium]
MINKIKIFAGSASLELASGICAELATKLGASCSRKFYNDQTFVAIEENVREADVFVVQTCDAPVNDRLMELLMLINALRGASAKRVTAVLPHFFYQQSDKKDQPRICITAKLVADMLTTAGANRVLTMDLHAAQIQGFFSCPVDNLTATPLLCDHFASRKIEDLVIVATDVGRANLVRRYARRLSAPLAIIDKVRINETRTQSVHVIGDVEGKNVLLIDDLIGTGGSLIGAAQLVKERGANRVYAGAVHGVLPGDSVRRLEDSLITEIAVMDTIPVRHKLSATTNFTVLSAAPPLAKAIHNINAGESVSALFT